MTVVWRLWVWWRTAESLEEVALPTSSSRKLKKELDEDEFEANSAFECKAWACQ